MEDVVSRASAIVLEVPPVQLVVVYEGAIEDDPAVGRQSGAITLAASAGMRP